VVEIPVTVMRYVLGAWPPLRHAYHKLLSTSPDGSTLWELREFVERGAAGGLRVMNLFMHSYSLLECDHNMRKIRPSFTKLKRLECLLGSLAADPGMEFLDSRAFWRRFQESPETWDGPDFVPEVAAPGTICSLGARKIGRNLRQSLTRRAS